MKEIRLLSLTTRNFKGIKKFVLETGGQDTSVFGDNGTFKTTQFDAFTWLTFDKDSKNNSTSNFKIKTQDKLGNDLHNLEHEVEGVLMIDGKHRTLRKMYAEKWTKKRGSVSPEFSGHTTTYFIDGVPSTKGEYDTFVNGIIQEDLFKLLTSPSYFNEQLHWKERRKTLIEVCGDVSEADVIGSSKKLSKLPSILGDYSIDDYRKIITGRRTKINEELEKIPVRIDELQRSMPDLAGTDEEFLQDDIASLKKRIEDKEAELSRIQSGGEVAVKEKRQRELEGELQHLKNQLQSSTMDKVSAQRELVNSISSQQGRLKREVDDKQQRIEQNNRAIERGAAERSKLLEQYSLVNAEAFESHHDENCPSCGQSLPADQIEAAHEKALAEFNRKKSGRSETIGTQGKAAKAECIRLENENLDLSAALEELNVQYDQKSKERYAADAELEALQAGMTDVSSDPAYISKLKEIEAVKSEILGLRSSNLGQLEKVRLELAELRLEVGRLEQQNAQFAQVKSANERIEELMEQEKDLADEFAKLEEELFLTEEFIRSKVAMLESKINNKFKLVRFKLFEPQVNGGLQECCDTMVDGVPYGAGLNNAAEINAGLDIINTLSEYHGYAAPIFIDNAEAVTRLIDTVGQKISLIVSEKDKQLRVESKKMKEAV